MNVAAILGSSPRFMISTAFDLKAGHLSVPITFFSNNLHFSLTIWLYSRRRWTPQAFNRVRLKLEIERSIVGWICRDRINSSISLFGGQNLRDWYRPKLTIKRSRYPRTQMSV